ncbi:sugar phosphate isomerase/epimerase family protein [Tsukamurella soli]|uniref:sugar phosphate isomerase/epimerase family protein n=1 Tax=Tsukamurella soli TaxID=644556 RepID=UPI0031E6CDA3
MLDTPPARQLALAERTGYDTVGLRLLPAAPATPAYPVHTDRRALADLAARLRDSPVGVFDIEIVRIAPDFRAEEYRSFFEAGNALGARAALVAGDDPDSSRLADSYAALAVLAAEHDMVASLEFMPWTCVPDARAAVEIVAQAERPSVLVDALHAARSATTLADIAALPRGWLHYAQLCDGTVPAPADDAGLIHDARSYRLAPGEGGIDLAAMWSRLPAGLPVSVELPNEPQRREMGTEAWLRHLAERARAVLAAASAHRDAGIGSDS